MGGDNAGGGVHIGQKALVAPQQANTTYLMDMDGNVVNEWKSDYGCRVYFG